MGFIDWLTTVVGILYFGAAEINPLFAGMTKTNLLAFSGIKLTTTVLIGFLFYKAYAIKKTPKVISQFEKRFLKSGYLLALMTLSVVVTNNVMAVTGAI